MLRAVVLLLIICLASCKKVAPKDPVITAFDAPLKAESSYVSAPIVFDVKALEEKINQSLGQVIVDQEEQKSQKGKIWKLRVERSGRVRIAYDGHRLTFGAPLTIWIINPLTSKKKAADRRALCSIDVEFNSPISVRQDWKLETKVSLNKYRWIEQPNIRLLGFDIPVTDLAEGILKNRRKNIEDAINEAIYTELHLDREIQKIWQELQKPLLLNRQFENIWLIPMPRSVQVSDVYGDEKTIVVPLRVYFNIETRFGPEPQVAIKSKLPPLQKVDTLPLVSELNLLSRIPYNDLNQTLARTLDNQEVKLSSRIVRIRSASVYGGGNTLILKSDVKGSVNGTLFFRGRPAYDTLQHKLLVKNLKFDVNTEEVLLSTADWLLHDSLQETFETALSVPLKQHLEKIPTKIEEAFAKGKTGEKALIDIQQFRLTPRNIAIRPEAVQVLINVRATMMLKVKKL